ncbi:MAG: PQQ-binding-like beta-propeller repeat protein [Gemmataceae bacterium]
MHSNPALRRVLSGLATLIVMLAVLGAFWWYQGQTPSTGGLTAQESGMARSWTVWGGTVQRNLVNTLEKNIAREWDASPGKEKNVLWSINLGSKAYGGPTIGNGRIFIGTNNNRPRDKDVKGDKGIVMCFRESTGEFLWQLVHDKLDAGRVNDWPEEGICSAPVIEGNRIWYVSNRCEVICATTDGLAAGNAGPFQEEKYTGKQNGDIVWKLDMIKALGVFPHNLATCSPLIVGDILFIITSNGVDEGHVNIPAPNAPSFLAIDKNSGKVLWQDRSPGRNIMHGQWSNPVYTVANGKPQIIFPGGDGYIYAFDPKSGELIWKFDCNPKGAIYRLGGNGTKNDFVSTPVIADNKLYIGVGQDPEHKKGVGHLWCIDITKTPTNPQKDLSPYSDPKVEIPDKFDPKDPRNKDSGLVWHYGGLNPDQEGREFRYGRTLSTCAVTDGLCYAGEFDGVLHCLDAQTGKKHWEYELEADTWSSPFVVDGHVYIGNENGVMHIFKHGPKMELVRKISMKGKIRATPVACNGVLYVMTENPCKLYAIKP